MISNLQAIFLYFNLVLHINKKIFCQNVSKAILYKLSYFYFNFLWFMHCTGPNITNSFNVCMYVCICQNKIVQWFVPTKNV